MRPLFQFLICCCLVQPLTGKEPVDYIDPFIGTGKQGKTFPGAATPTGMVQLSPDTITGGDNGSGYRYKDQTIQGFSFTHMSGVGWFGDLGNFLVTPTTGPLKTWYGKTGQPGSGYLSTFSKNSESASAGYYSVVLDDYKIKAELTAASHSGILRFTFPANGQSRIQIDLARRVGGTSLKQAVKVVDEQTIEGYIECTPDGGGWGHGGGNPRYTFYFHAEFSKPLKKFGVWQAKIPDEKHHDSLEKDSFISACENAAVTPLVKEATGRHLGFFTEFPTNADDKVLLKVGISFVSIEGARNNLQAEIPDWNFDKVHQQARALWADELQRMMVSGGSEEQKTVFYTAMYHTLIDPRIFADVNGDYPGGDGKAHQTRQFTKRTIFSGWDVYRSTFPLLTIIAPDIVNDMINSMIELADQNGTHYYDRWELLNAYSGCMNGNPMITVLNDAYQKGIRNYDVAKAYEYAVNSVEKWGNGKLGYCADEYYGLSKTFEYAANEWNLSQLAKSLGKTEDAEKYAKLSLGYRNLFDPSVPWTYDKEGKKSNPQWQGWFHAKDKNGNWLPWLGLESEDKSAQEASIYQQGWGAPHDVPGLIELLGGQESFVAKLSDFFNRTPNITKWNPYYNHPNEPVHLLPFLFNRADAPWLTQKWVRHICESYQTGPDGLCGDEDVGQMSAWFILAAAGLHQACPGDLRYEVFTPLFDKVVIQLDKKYANGGIFTVSAQNNSSQNIYIQSASLNGKPLNRCWITHQEIVGGGRLELILGPQPNQQWGIENQ
jgi:predicted alpha-1,2-mannosidase